MGLNVSTATGFENRDMLKNMAENILRNNNASKETVSKIVDKALFANELYTQSSLNPQLAILKASTQISLNSSLNETLKYLKAHSNKKSAKKPILGELWNIIETNNNGTDDNQYKGELIDFQIDMNRKNIFAA